MITIAIRIILSLILIYFIYGETGGATAFTIFLIMLNSELQAYLSNQKEKLEITGEILSRLKR